MAKVWNKRTTAPALNDVNYITIAGGGINGCIQGNPSGNREKNRQSKYSVLPNCTGYAHGRSLEIMKATKPCSELPVCNAEDWNDMSKWKRGNTPKLGAIACWRSGNNWNSSDGCGHVAVVEEIYSDGSYLISESGWSSFYFRTRRVYKDNVYGSGLTFECFLYNPYADRNYSEDKPTSFFPAKGYWGFGDKDPRIGKISDFMYACFPLYTDKRALGDYYGYYIQASIKEFQRRTGLVPDGYFGPLTLAELKKYGFKE